MKYRWVILPLLLCGCKENANHLEYEDFLDYHIDVNDLYNQENQDYLVYFYSLECHECQEMKDEMLGYVGSYSLYFVEHNPSFLFEVFPHNEYSQIYNLATMRENHPNNIDETYYFGAPSLYRIKEHRFEDLYLGKEEILNYLKENI